MPIPESEWPNHLRWSLPNSVSPGAEPVRPAVNPYLNDKPIPLDIHVEEQAADLGALLDDMLARLEPFSFDNSTAEGRLRGELSYIRQELEAGRLPIPGPKDITSTTRYIASEWVLDARVGESSQIKHKLYNIDSIIICEGLVKPRHYPRLIELCELGISTMESIRQAERGRLTQDEVGMMDAYILDLKGIAQSLFAGVDDIFDLTKTHQNFYRSQIPDLVFEAYVIEQDLIYKPFENLIRGAIGSDFRPLQPQPSLGWEMPDWAAERSR